MSLNDPRWGNKPDSDRKAQEGRRPGEGGGPPDLDQLWRDFNARLNRIFGRRGGDGSYRPDMRGAGITVSLAVLVAAVIWLASGAFIVQEGQVGVVTTFGQLSHITGAGFNWRWPYPFQSHRIVNVGQVRTAEIGYRANVRNKQPQEALMLTDDDNIVDAQFAVQYKVKDPVAWVFNNRDQDETVRQVAETALRQVVGASRMDYVLYEGRDKVAAGARDMMQQLLDRYALGVQVTGVTMQAVSAPDPVQAAFDDAYKASEDRLRARTEGEAYANDVIPRAKGQAQRLVQDAEAYRSMVVDNAMGNAARFNQVVAEYAKAPAVTRTRMYLDTMQQIFTSSSKVMVDTKANNTIYLPLDKLAGAEAPGGKSGPVQPAQPQQQSAPQQQSPQQSGQPQQAAPAQDVQQTMESVRNRDSRSRDATLERERERR